MRDLGFDDVKSEEISQVRTILKRPEKIATVIMMGFMGICNRRIVIVAYHCHE